MIYKKRDEKINVLKDEFNLNSEPDSFFDSMIRSAYIGEYGFVLLHNKIIDDLVNYIGSRKVADLGSGSGYLSHRLAERGVDVTAIDNTNRQFSKIWKLDIQEDFTKLDLDEYEVLILAWPEMSSEAFDVATKLKPHQELIYQGESQGGCTADHKFFKYVEQYFKETGLFNDNHLRFDGVHDHWYSFKL